MDIDAVQQQLHQMKIDGWLLYDFHGINPIARDFAGMAGKMITRRWFCLIPVSGKPRWLVSKLEASEFGTVPGEIHTYHSWTTLNEGLAELVRGCPKVAMEYTPHGTIPYISRVDAGTMEMIRALNITPVSSADLVQWFQARWSPASLSLHLKAAKHLRAAMQRAHHLIRQFVTAGRRISEYDVQQEIMRYFQLHNLVTDSPPIVATTANTNSPHYTPDETRNSLIEKEDLVLIDMWAKVDHPDGMYADITWMAYVGLQVPDDYSRIFSVVTTARDAAAEFIVNSVENEKTIKGYEVDDVARTVVKNFGYEDKFIHRTGHNLHRDVHGPGVNFDNLENHDERLLIPDIACTIEPGIYLRPFGFRSEINVYIGEKRAQITTEPQQKHIIPLLSEQ